MDEEELQLTEQGPSEGWSMESNKVGRNTIAITFKKSLKMSWK